MIVLEHVTKAFNGHVVLDDVSLRIERDELVALLGSSGTGKSVLLQHVIGLMSPDRGRIIVDNNIVTEMSERELLKLRKDMGYLFQDGALYDFMTVGENLAFPLKENSSMKTCEIEHRVIEYLEMVDMRDAKDVMPSELSGGMRKRAALVRALILDAKVLLCDEPTSGLDPIRSKDISILIRDLSKRMKTTTIVTSHDMVNAFRIADRVLFLNQGGIVVDGTVEDFRSSKDTFVQQFLE